MPRDSSTDLLGLSFELRKSRLNAPNAVPPINPASLQNVKFLMDTSVPGINFTINTALTSTCVNSSFCLGVKDQSGNNNNATQATTANAFIYLTNQINGQPAIVTAGTSSVLSLANTITCAGAFTLYSVFTYVASTSLGFIGGTAFNNGADILSSVGSIKVGLGLNGVTAPLTYNGPFQPTPVAMRFRRDTNNVAHFAWSGTIDTSVQGNSGNFTVDHVLAYLHAGVISSPLNAVSFLCLAADDTLVTGEDNGVCSYIYSQFGLSLP